MPKNAAPKETTATLQLLSHSGQVLLFLARNPSARMRDVAEHLGITERAVSKIVSDLESAGWLTRSRSHNDGRRYRYALHVNQTTRHPAEAELQLTLLLRIDEEALDVRLTIDADHLNAEI